MKNIHSGETRLLLSEPDQGDNVGYSLTLNTALIRKICLNLLSILMLSSADLVPGTNIPVVKITLLEK